MQSELICTSVSISTSIIVSNIHINLRINARLPPNSKIPIIMASNLFVNVPACKVEVITIKPSIAPNSCSCHQIQICDYAGAASCRDISKVNVRIKPPLSIKYPVPVIV